MRRWSQEALASHDPTSLPNDIQDSGWLGYPSATDAEIAQAESRLNTIFPPSYRAFLKVSNGWRQTTPFIDRLWSTEEIEWFTTRHSDWIEDFIRRYGDRDLENDANYEIYGPDQDCRTLRSQFLYSSLEISQKGDSSIYLLNPQVTTANGEWEAWFFGNWLPGADRYRSFEELMQAEYQNFLELRGG